MKNLKKSQGFTLIEILVVIGIIAVLAGIVIIAINPARQFAQARNSQRESNVNTILNAIGQRLADNKGVWDAVSGSCSALPSSADPISDTDTDLSCLTPTYIPSQLPVDPSVGEWTDEDDYDTGYTVEYDSTTGRVTVCAPEDNEENGSVKRDICVTR